MEIGEWRGGESGEWRDVILRCAQDGVGSNALGKNFSGQLYLLNNHKLIWLSELFFAQIAVNPHDSLSHCHLHPVIGPLEEFDRMFGYDSWFVIS